MWRRIKEQGAAVSAWALTGLWTALIWMAIPFARRLQATLADAAGHASGLVVATFLGGLLGLGALAWVWRRPRRDPVRKTAWLAALGVFSVWMLTAQLQSSVEAFHVFEYAILAFLLYRAWCRQMPDPLVYPIAALSVALVSWGDEFLQWMMPGRFWDFRDIRLNVLAGVGMLVFIAQVIRPEIIRLPVARRSIRRLCWLAWALLLTLGVASAGTPARVDQLARRAPFLRFLYNNESILAEYGYRHADPAIGVFYSRLALPDLLRHDREHGAAAGPALSAIPGLADPRKFRETFPVSADPFLQEAAAHLLRRDYYYATAWKYQESDPRRFAYHLAVALGENRILEKYFPQTLATAGRQWGADRRMQILRSADQSMPYVSEVANHLIVACAERQLQVGLLALAAIFAGIYIRWGRDKVARA